MKHSDSITKIIPALLTAQKAIKHAVKDALNPHLKTMYADLPSVIDAIKEHLNNAGIVYLQTPGETANNYLFLTTTLFHESGEWIQGTMSVPIVKQDPQGFGSSLTYARRYALASITGLKQEDDDGEKAVAKKKKETHSATDNAFESQDSDMQKKIVQVSQKIKASFLNGEDWSAFDAYSNSGLDNDAKVGLWQLLDSKARSSLKKMGQEAQQQIKE